MKPWCCVGKTQGALCSCHTCHAILHWLWYITISIYVQNLGLARSFLGLWIKYFDFFSWWKYYRTTTTPVHGPFFFVFPYYLLCMSMYKPSNPFIACTYTYTPNKHIPRSLIHQIHACLANAYKADVNFAYRIWHQPITIGLVVPTISFCF